MRLGWLIVAGFSLAGCSVTDGIMNWADCTFPVYDTSTWDKKNRPSHCPEEQPTATAKAAAPAAPAPVSDRYMLPAPATPAHP